MGAMSDLQVLEMQEAQQLLPDLFDSEQVVYDDESCALCGSRNFELLEENVFECYECGKLFERGNQ